MLSKLALKGTQGCGKNSAVLPFHLSFCNMKFSYFNKECAESIVVFVSNGTLYGCVYLYNHTNEMTW